MQPRNKGATDATAKETGEELVRTMRLAGVREVGLTLKRMSPVATASAIATV